MGGQIRAHPDHGLQRHGLGDRVAGMAPGLAPDPFRRFEEVPHESVEFHGFARAAAIALDRSPGSGDPPMQLVEQLGLQDPFFLLAASAEAIDPIAQRAVRLAVEQLDDAGGELFVGCRP